MPVNAICGMLLFRWSTDFERRTSQIDTLNEYRLRFIIMHSVWNSCCPNHFPWIDALKPLQCPVRLVAIRFARVQYKCTVLMCVVCCVYVMCVVGGVEKRILSLLHDWTLTFWPVAKFKQHFLIHVLFGVFTPFFPTAIGSFCQKCYHK